MNDNYLLLIVLISVVLYLMHQKCDKKDKHKHTHHKEKNNVPKKQKQKQKQKQKDDFQNVFNMDIGKYIDTTIDNLIEDKQLLDIKNLGSNYQGLKIHGNDEEIKNMLDNISDFTDKFDRYSRITNNENINLSEDIQNKINQLKNNDSNIYNSFVQDFYDKYKAKLLVEETILSNKIGLHGVDDNKEGFADTQIAGDNTIVSFLGRYTVLPYQYSGFNNVYMGITKYGIENNNTRTPPNIEELRNKYILSFYLLDELVVEYEIDLYIKDKTLLDLMPVTENNNNNNNQELNTYLNIDIMNNLAGIVIDIKKEIPIYKPTYNIVRKEEVENIKNILGNIGISSNKKLYLFLTDSQYEKRYFNLNGGLTGVSKDAYYQDSDDDLFRCYSSNSTTLLHLKKSNLINKPFQSLTGSEIINKLDIY